MRLAVACSLGCLVVATASVAASAASAKTPSSSGVSASPSAPSSPGPKANPCKGVKNCVTVGGPWVAVPSSGEANFLMECPKRSGTIGGIDALATSADVRVVWEGNVGSPVRPGTTTTFLVYFHAYSARGQNGLFQPYIGCIPTPKVNPRSTLSARIARPGPGGLDHWETLVNVKSGTSQTVTRGCGKKGERLLDAWHSVAFGASVAPNPALANKVHVTVTIAHGAVVASIHTDAGLPAVAQPQVQIGAVCAK
jgi:hypothetical protein